MPKSTTNWESTQTWQRLVASIIATGVKLDLKAAALYFGTTYDTLENKLRKIKKDASKLKDEIDNGECGEVPSSRMKNATPRKGEVPKKDVLGTVATGRVGKATTGSRKDTIDIKHKADADMSNSVVRTLFSSSPHQPKASGVDESEEEEFAIF